MPSTKSPQNPQMLRVPYTTSDVPLMIRGYTRDRQWCREMFLGSIGEVKASSVTLVFDQRGGLVGLA